jgi:serine O-acetyltransferase
MQFLVRIHKTSRWLLDRRLRRLSRVLDTFIRLVYAARIPAIANIHPTTHFSHNGLAVVITKLSHVSAGCTIGTHVLLGSRWPMREGPYLEENVIVHAGARIIGPVRIGSGSVIGANAVVLTDIPPQSLAVGVPAVVKKTEIENGAYKPDLQAAETVAW